MGCCGSLHLLVHKEGPAVMRTGKNYVVSTDTCNKPLAHDAACPLREAVHYHVFKGCLID